MEAEQLASERIGPVLHAVINLGIIQRANVKRQNLFM